MTRWLRCWFKQLDREARQMVLSRFCARHTQTQRAPARLRAVRSKTHSHTRQRLVQPRTARALALALSRLTSICSRTLASVYRTPILYIYVLNRYTGCGKRAVHPPSTSTLRCRVACGVRFSGQAPGTRAATPPPSLQGRRQRQRRRQRLGWTRP